MRGDTKDISDRDKNMPIVIFMYFYFYSFFFFLSALSSSRIYAGQMHIKQASSSMGDSQIHLDFPLSLPLCHFFVQGNCRYGEFCKYSHGPRNDHGRQGNGNNGPSRDCFAYKRKGHCFHGSSCRYIHSNLDRNKSDSPVGPPISSSSDTTSTSTTTATTTTMTTTAKATLQVCLFLFVCLYLSLPTQIHFWLGRFLIKL